jgi:hypothetical protein
MHHEGKIKACLRQDDGDGNDSWIAVGGGRFSLNRVRNRFGAYYLNSLKLFFLRRIYEHGGRRKI